MCKPVGSKITLVIETPDGKSLEKSVDMSIHWAKRLQPIILDRMSLSLEQLQKDLEQNAEAEFLEEDLFS